APAHHPERALFGTTVLLALFVVDVGLERVLPARRVAAAVCVAVLWAASIARDMGDAPGKTPSEDRSAQIARGRRLRDERAQALVVTPCAYEHFALLAAYGAPERAEIRPRRDLPECPSVEVP